MLLVTGVVAVIAYEWLGVGFLRRGWINFGCALDHRVDATGTLLLLVLSVLCPSGQKFKVTVEVVQTGITAAACDCGGVVRIPRQRTV